MDSFIFLDIIITYSRTIVHLWIFDLVVSTNSEYKTIENSAAMNIQICGLSTTKSTKIINYNHNEVTVCK